MRGSTKQALISEILVSPDMVRIYQKDKNWIQVSDYPASIEPETGEVGMLATTGKNGVVKKILRRVFCP